MRAATIDPTSDADAPYEDAVVIADDPQPATVPAVLPAGPGALASPGGGLPFADPAVLRAQLERYTATRGVFLEWIAANLTPGTDFQLIHRKIGSPKADCPNKGDTSTPRCQKCGGKATLCKPGSEKIAGLLQLTPRFRLDADTVEMIGKPGVLAFVCDLVNAAGVAVAEGRGARSVGQDFDDANKTVKMAQKSAQIDATLRLAGLSEVFTQDLEDMPAGGHEDDPPAFTPPQRTGAAPTTGPAPAPAPAAAGANATPPPRDAISEARVKRVYALMHQALAQVGADDATARSAVEAELDAFAKTHGRQSWKHISWKVYDEMCGLIPAIVQKLAGKS